MHLRNKSYHFEIYTDTNNLNLLKNNLLWMNHAEIVNFIIATNKHVNWMAYKIDYLITCINNDRILVDSETIWFSDLTYHINSNYIYLSHLAYHFSDNDDEAKHLVWLFGEAILDYMHFVTCIVYIPKNHWNIEYSTRLTNNFKVLYDYFSKNNLTYLQRLSEELAINITLQQIFPAHLLRVVKNTGSDISRHIYQPIYFGAENKIL